MKLKSFFLFLFIGFSSISQNSNYLDSLEIRLKKLSKPQQLKAIVEIPYDKFVDNISTSEKLIITGKHLAISMNDSLSLAKIYFKLSQISAYKDKSEEKIEYILKSIKIYENLGKKIEAGVAYGQLGYSIKFNDMKLAFYYMRKSIQLIESTKDNTQIDPIYDNYGTLHLLNKNTDSSLYYHKKSLALKKQLKDKVGLGYGYANVADSYAELKKYEIAKKYMDSSLVIRQKLNDNYGISVSYTHIADINFAEKKYKDAIINYKKSGELAKQFKYQHLEKYCAESITECYLQLNDYKNAFAYNKIFQSLKDSTVNLETNSRVAQLQIEFETEKKEKEIAIQKEQLLKNKLEIKTKNTYALLMASGLLILSIILFALYKRQQHKKREYTSQLQLKEAQTYSELQEQRLRISRDLHDNIGSQLTFIISSIDNLKFLTDTGNEKLRNKLTEINQFAGNTISQLRDTIWAMNKNEITFEDFHGRVLSLIEKAKASSNNIQIKFNSTINSAIIFPSTKGINMFRVIQEAINNTLKHAEATEISIAIYENDTSFFIDIKDNGKGFDRNTINLGNGLENIQQRIKELDGKISISSEIGKGTAIKISCLKNRSNAV